MKRDDSLFYTCSLIEYMGRLTKNRRGEVIRKSDLYYQSREYLAACYKNGADADE